MEYKIDIYRNDEEKKLRYALGKKGNNPLVVLGLNPSTANDLIPDRTINKVRGIVEGAKLDGFIMLNLYPQSSTDPNKLDLEFNTECHKDNLNIIQEVLYGMNDIQVLVGYGNKIMMRPYLKQCMKEIVSVVSKHNPKWLKTGDLTKPGHPRHPLYVAYAKGLTEFDMQSYLSRL